METIVGIIIRLMQSRDAVHLAHFKTDSYAKHVALDDYYKEIVEIFDRLTETAQGEKRSFLELKVPASIIQEDISKYLEDLATYIESKQKSLKSYQVSILDDGLELIYKTIYKLTLLK